ncbi:MAG TPA: transposase [Caulobacteraceae bacterium]|nr:transposase [Caulobacteraceae bacterium]
MPRIARLVVPGAPHQVTQRGNRKGVTFFNEGDYSLYLDLLAETSAKAGVEVWAYCLMPNHVHVVLTPSDPDGLRRTFGDLHRRYTRHINARNAWNGHLWQGRFGSVAMDEGHLANAVRYVSLNPVRARLAETPEAWPWSSVRAHLAGQDDKVVKVAPVLGRVGDFAGFLTEAFDEAAAFAGLRQSETTGRPLGAKEWIVELESGAGRALAPRKRGPRPR